MSPHPSPPAVLVLHAVRLLGFADEARIAARFRLDRGEVSELLGDFEAFGWASHSRFAGLGGWALTDTGRAQNGEQLAAELEVCGARALVSRARADFDPMNARFLEAVTGLGIDSCHGVWMQLHEDLLATLGVDRGSAPSP